jgi:hypothetical protein
MRTRILRIQDAEGRGPYRPGMSQHWVDAEGPPPPPTWMEEFGPNIVNNCEPDECMGCGFRTLDQLFKWFTKTELQKMQALGYQLVVMWADRIVAESEHQVVFARKKPLAHSASVMGVPYEARP